MMLTMVPRKPANRGKSESYDPEENEMLRQTLVEYADNNKLSSTRVGELLGVSQQTANGYMNGTGGFSRPAAIRFCQKLLGYESDAHFLQDRGVFMGQKGKPLGAQSPQEFAMQLARRAGVSELAVGRVNKRYEGEPHHHQQWWLDRYLQEERAVKEERLARLEALKKRDDE